MSIPPEANDRLVPARAALDEKFELGERLAAEGRMKEAWDVLHDVAENGPEPLRAEAARRRDALGARAAAPSPRDTFLFYGGNVSGPFSVDELARRVSRKELTRESRVARAADGPFTPLGNDVRFAAVFGDAPLMTLAAGRTPDAAARFQADVAGRMGRLLLQAGLLLGGVALVLASGSPVGIVTGCALMVLAGYLRLARRSSV